MEIIEDTAEIRVKSGIFVLIEIPGQFRNDPKYLKKATEIQSVMLGCLHPGQHFEMEIHGNAMGIL